MMDTGWLDAYMAHWVSMQLDETLSPITVTLHGGDIPEDENGRLDETVDIPEIARVQMESFTGTIRFENLPECDVKHVAVWTASGRLLLRAYCFPVEDHPEWVQTRRIPDGGSVEVSIA